MKASWLIYSGVYSVLFFASNCHICISDKLRKRVSWNVCELGYLQYRSHYTTTFPFLESVLAYSPEGYFSDGEREIAKSILSKCPQFVELEVREPEIMPLAVKLSAGVHFAAVGVSLNTMIAAVAHVGGTISVVCLPSLVELWQYSTEFKSISHCTFGPDGSFISFGRLGTVFDIAERKEVPYFCGNEETFTCCAFSPNGKRLVTSDGSDAVKLWDVAKQSLLTSLDAAVPVNSCTFSSSGLFIIAGKEAVYSFDEDEAEEADSFCTWSTITWQRSHGRNLHEEILEERVALRSKTCNRCLRPGKSKPTRRVRNLVRRDPQWSGMYFCCGCSQCLMVIEMTHFTTMAAWVLDSSPLKITALEDNVWLLCSYPLE